MTRSNSSLYKRFENSNLIFGKTLIFETKILQSTPRTEQEAEGGFIKNKEEEAKEEEEEEHYIW